MNAAEINVEVLEERAMDLDEYGRVSIAFEVASVLELEVRGGGLGGIALAERALECRYVKDYDVIEGPRQWARRFDLSRWGSFAALVGGRRVGGALVAFHTKNVHILEERNDLAALWDIRVAPEMRGKGIGGQLFQAALSWASRRGCLLFKIETQNINVPACRFYARQGCELGGIHRFAYPDFPAEVQLLWYKQLSPHRARVV